MRLYIAGPMTGLPEYNYFAFRAAEAELCAAGFDILNPVDVDITGTTDDERTWEWYMRQTLKMMLDADGVALLDGWHRSRGASIEVRTALSLSMKTASVDVWIEEGKR